MHTATLLQLTVLISATLALCVGVLARRDRSDGLSSWGLALLMHALGYVLITLREHISDWLSIVLANALLVSVMALILEGLYRFYQRKPSRLWLWAPVPLLGLVFAVLLDNIHARIVVLAVVMSAQFALSARLMVGHWRTTPGHGKQFVLAGLGLLALVVVLRACMVLAGWAVLTTIHDVNPAQSMLFSLTPLALVLATLGMVVMTKERADERNRTLALVDELTGLPNRRYAQQTLLQHLAQAQRAQRPLSLLMLDIDHFKGVNDSHGHLSGDKVLKQLAEIIRSRVRVQDMVGRWGGEEFVVILPDTDADGAGALAEQLRAEVQQARFSSLSGQPIALTISIGVHALHHNDGNGLETMVGMADRALYRAKAHGRNRVEAL